MQRAICRRSFCGRPLTNGWTSSAILTTQLIFDVTPVSESTFLDLFHSTAHFLGIRWRHNVVCINQPLWFHEYAITQLREGHKIALLYPEFLKEFTGDDDLATLSNAPMRSLVGVVVFVAIPSGYLIARKYYEWA
jgi:hypothetical protein